MSREVKYVNLIACDSKCIHQKDGYCALQRTDIVSRTPSSDCLYFISSEPMGTPDGNSSQNGPSLPYASNSDQL
jgi:hypothetical protein